MLEAPLNLRVLGSIPRRLTASYKRKDLEDFPAARKGSDEQQIQVHVASDSSRVVS